MLLWHYHLPTYFWRPIKSRTFETGLGEYIHSLSASSSLLSSLWFSFLYLLFSIGTYPSHLLSSFGHFSSVLTPSVIFLLFYFLPSQCTLLSFHVISSRPFSVLFSLWNLQWSHKINGKSEIHRRKGSKYFWQQRLSIIVQTTDPTNTRCLSLCGLSSWGMIVLFSLGRAVYVFFCFVLFVFPPSRVCGNGWTGCPSPGLFQTDLYSSPGPLQVSERFMISLLMVLALVLQLDFIAFNFCLEQHDIYIKLLYDILVRIQTERLWCIYSLNVTQTSGFGLFILDLWAIFSISIFHCDLLSVGVSSHVTLQFDHRRWRSSGDFYLFFH